MSVTAPINQLARKEILEFAVTNKSVANAVFRLLQTALRALPASAAFAAFFDEYGRLKVHASHGLDAAALTQSNFLDQKFIGVQGVSIIEDTANHTAFANDAWIENSGVRFFAALPMRTATRALIGFFCVLDHEPRRLTADQHKILKDFSTYAAEAILLRLENVLLRHASRKMQREKIQVEERLDRVVSSLPLPYFTVDKRGLISSWNRACVDRFGYSPDDVRGEKLVGLTSSVDSGRQIELLIQRVFKRRRISGIKLTITTKNGGASDMLCRMFPYFDMENNVAFCVFVNTELTERPNSEPAPHEPQAELRKMPADLMQLKFDFLSNASREIDSPLTSVIEFADFLEGRKNMESIRRGDHAFQER